MAAQREIAPVIVLDTLGRFLLQQRDDIPEIICPGMIGLFGGHREGRETFHECAVRELREELTFDIDSKNIRFLVSKEGADGEVEGGLLRAHFFITRDIPVDKVSVTEGSLLIVNRWDIGSIHHRLTPSARFALDFFFEQSEER